MVAVLSGCGKKPQVEIDAANAAIENSIIEAQGVYDKDAYMDALNKIKASKEREVSINTELKDAIAKVNARR